MRKVIAKRLSQSKAQVPHFYSTIECEIDAMLAFRAKLKKDLGINVSVNDLVIKAAALALRDVPEANSQLQGGSGRLRLVKRVDISVAVATPSGLITPIVTDADRRGLSNINAIVKDLATRARDGKLKPEEYQGGSFTISNLGASSSCLGELIKASVLLICMGCRHVWYFRVLRGDQSPASLYSRCWRRY